MREKRTWTSARMLLIGSPFELSRGNITEPAMTTMRVIPPLEPRENLSASFVSCRETVSVQHFRLKAREKRLHHRIIEAVANATHGPRDAQFPAARGEGHSRVFGSVIGMVDDSIGTALRITHLQSRQHELTSQA
jgi:hypothetical protein